MSISLTTPQASEAPEELDYVYLDNASTSLPKPDAVFESQVAYSRALLGNPGRASRGGAVIEDARADVAAFLGIARPQQLAFTLNATHALNVVLQGALRPGDHVITTCTEHNSVLRPLELLRARRRISIDVAPVGEDCLLSPLELERRINASTRLIVVNHASNVTGVVAPVDEIAKIAAAHGVPLLVDASQTAGILDLNVDELGAAFVVFTGHKALLGPSGVGGMYVRNPETLDALVHGGSGTNSLSLRHPETPPVKFEAGTLNYLGIVGLTSGIAALRSTGLAQVRAHERGLMHACLEELERMPSIRTYGCRDLERRVPIISFEVDGFLATEVADFLQSRHRIITRGGIHCAPLMHKALGTSRRGTLRVSFGPCSSATDVERLLRALRSLIGGAS